MKMDLNKLIKNHAHVIFNPHGKDEFGVFMIIENHRIHLRTDDYQLVEGLPLEDVWPLIDDVKRL